MDILLGIYIFMLGAALGSFALVVAERWDSKRSWVKGRSQCDSCKKTLQPLDLVPVFSWIFTKGRCRHCDKKVPKRYPLSEAVSGALLLAVYIFFPYELEFNSVGMWLFILWLLIHTLCMILVLIDLKSMIMPYKFLFPLIGTGLVFRSVLLTSDIESSSIVSVIIAVLLGGGLFGLLWVISRGKWIGDSDILLGIAIALLVGGPVEVWIAFVTASFIGLLFGIISSFIKKNKLAHMKIPFGPFLVLGLVVSFLFAQEIIDLYLNVFLPY